MMSGQLVSEEHGNHMPDARRLGCKVASYTGAHRFVSVTHTSESGFPPPVHVTRMLNWIIQ